MDVMENLNIFRKHLVKYSILKYSEKNSQIQVLFKIICQIPEYQNPFLLVSFCFRMPAAVPAENGAAAPGVPKTELQELQIKQQTVVDDVKSERMVDFEIAITSFFFFYFLFFDSPWIVPDECWRYAKR